MESLDLLVNTSTGVTHPSDRSTAIEIFKTLKGKQVKFNPDEIRAWLVAEKQWNPSDADDVKELAEDVQAGKQFQYERRRLADDIFEQWQDEAGKNN